MPFNHLLRKCTPTEKLINRKKHKKKKTKRKNTKKKNEKKKKKRKRITHLMYMDEIKLPKNEKELETLMQPKRIYSQDIGMEFGIRECLKLHHESYEKRESGTSRR